MFSYNCDYCNKIFSCKQRKIRNKVKFCNTTCYYNYCRKLSIDSKEERLSKKRKFICQYCGIEFIPKVRKCKKDIQKYCSIKCRGLFQRGKPKTRKSEVINCLIKTKNNIFEFNQTNIRKIPEYYQWRKNILKRDNYTCIKCGSKKEIQVDHIIPLAFVVEELKVLGIKEYWRSLFDIDNGRTLCKECHKKTDSYLKPKEISVEYRLLKQIQLLYEKNPVKFKSFKECYIYYTNRIIDKLNKKIGELD